MRAAAIVFLATTVLGACANVECSFNSDCPQNARCEMNRCVRDCAEDRDCLDGEFCDPRGLCVSRNHATTDTGNTLDTGTLDTGTLDTGTLDTGTLDAGTPDAGTPDTGTPDTGTLDAGVPRDTGTLDTGTLDAGFDVTVSHQDSGPRDVGFDIVHTDGGVTVIDVGPTDLGALDLGPTDTGPRDTGTTTGPVSVGVYDYDGIRPGELRAPVAVAWHPSGTYALILSYQDTVFRFDAATRTVTRVASAGSSVYWTNVTFTPDGTQAVLLGSTISNSLRQGRIYLWNHNAQSLSERTTEFWPGGFYNTLVYNPDGTQAVLMGTTQNTSSSTFTLWRYDRNANRLSSPGPIARGLARSTACNDVAWIHDGFGDPALAVVCGTNTAAIYMITNLDGMPTIADGPSSGLIGNVFHITSRPQGDAAFTLGSSNKLYRYLDRTGMWEVGFNRPQLLGASAMAFSDDGARGLAFGGFGKLFEYRHDLYTQSDITEVSLALGSVPFNQPSQAFLNDVAWRPHCDAGLAVGGQNTFSGTTAFVAYFTVTNGRACNGP